MRDQAEAAQRFNDQSPDLVRAGLAAVNVLGGGQHGITLLLADGRALKITDDPIEAAMAEWIRREPQPAFPRVDEVWRHGPDFAIVREEVGDVAGSGIPMPGDESVYSADEWASMKELAEQKRLLRERGLAIKDADGPNLGRRSSDGTYVIRDFGSVIFYDKNFPAKKLVGHAFQDVSERKPAAFNPPEATCSVETLERYRELLLESGIAVGPLKRGAAAILCRKLTEGGHGGPPYSGNLIVSTDERVANLVTAGFFSSKDGEILALPPDERLLAPVRDAIYIEQFGDFYSNKQEPWASLARRLVSELQEKADARWLHLGARSTLCHQGQVVARAGSWSLSGRESSCVCGGVVVPLRVQLPSRQNVPGPSWVHVDYCPECEAGPVELRLGLAQARPRPTYGRRSHQHAWSRFRLPVADLSPEHRHFGFVVGYVCLATATVTTRSRRTKEPCLEVKNAHIEAQRVPHYSVPGAGRSKPETGLVTGRGHVHVWAILKGEFGHDEIRCVTCDGVLARMQVEVTAVKSRRVAANPADPSVLPLIGEGDETPDFLAERDRSRDITG
jgi:hypothetical protein